MNYITIFKNRNLSPILKVEREIDDIFNGFSPLFNKSILSKHIDEQLTQLSGIEEYDSHYTLTIDMPGVPQEQIKLELNNNILSVRGERKYKNQNENGYSRYQRSFTIPDCVDFNKIEANCKDGVLRVLLPKGEQSKPKEIKISNGEDSGFFDKFLGSKK